MHFQTLYTILFCPLLLFIILLTYDLNLLFNCLLRGFHTFELRIVECGMEKANSKDNDRAIGFYFLQTFL